MPYIHRSDNLARREFLRWLAALTFVAVVALVGFSEPISTDSGESPPPAAVEDAVAVSSNGVMFVLRNVGGRIAVLNPLETAVLDFLEIDVSALPESYLWELEGGVIIGSISELVGIVSEYESFT